MQIDIDFEVFKALTAELRSESESYNDVIRRALNLPDRQTAFLPGEFDAPGLPAMPNPATNQSEGAWFSNVFLPNGTQFRATYKGKTYRGQIAHSRWIDESGNLRTSPSEAASAISGTNVNGWRFWFVKRPCDEDWQRLDGLKA